MLTDAKARKTRPEAKTIADGSVKGLYLIPGKSAGSGKWILRFVSPESGKRRDMGLGTYPDVSIASVRRMGFEARELISRGIDPIDDRNLKRSNRHSRSAVPTFEQAARQVHADISPGFRNAKHRQQWINTLDCYIFPHIGNRPVTELTVADFADALRPIWLTRPETAGRVRQRCDKVMNWCAAKQYVMASPLGAINALLPRQPGKRGRVTHHPAVPWRDLPDVWTKLFDGSRMSIGRDALQFLILTAARSGEVRMMHTEEINLEKRIWTVPAQRMKSGVDHRVPLTDAAVSIVRERIRLTNTDNYLFSRSGETSISDMTLSKILRDHKIPSDTPGRTATPHGFRSSFRDWASENGYTRDLAERALSHTIPNETEAAYHRTDLLEARMPLMQAWEQFVESKTN